MIRQIELTDEERGRLREILQKHLTELSWEIAFTHSTDAVRFLRQRKEFLEGFVERLSG